ncbi:hypothetical protein HDU76_011275, partial [Blyttiomyces sp. JEL0837]
MAASSGSASTTSSITLPQFEIRLGHTPKGNETFASLKQRVAIRAIFDDFVQRSRKGQTKYAIFKNFIWRESLGFIIIPEGLQTPCGNLWCCGDGVLVDKIKTSHFCTTKCGTLHKNNVKSVRKNDTYVSYYTQAMHQWSISKPSDSPLDNFLYALGVVDDAPKKDQLLLPFTIKVIQTISPLPYIMTLDPHYY